MALATLSIDLVARLASLQEGFDKAARLAEKESARIDKAFAATKSTIVSLGGALAGAFSAGVMVQFVRATVNGIDALNDFADAVGTSVENASALEDAAARTGTTMDTVTAAALKLNQTLNAATPDSAQEKALKAIGLSAKELRALDPAEALLEVAKALQGYADGGNKARLVQELFGKSVREVAPFLKDLAESGRLNATVTTEQAKAAEAFNHQLANLSKNTADAARSLTGEFLPALNSILEAFNKRGLIGALDEFGEKIGFGKAYYAEQNIKKLTAALDDLQARIDKRRRFGEPVDALLAEQADKQARLAAAQRVVQAANAPQASYSNEGRISLSMLRQVPDLPGQVDKKKADDYLFIARQILEGEEQAAKDTAEAWKYWEDIQLKNSKELQDARALQLKQWFQTIDDEQERLIEEGRALIDDQAKKTKSLADELGLSFTSAFEDAIVGGRGLRDVLKGLEQDIIRIVTRKMITEPLGNSITGFLNGMGGGGGIGSFFSSLFSGFFADGGFIPPGRWGMTGERGPEAVFGGRSGATVVPGGRSVIVNVSMPAGADRRTGEQFGAQIAQQLSRASARNN